jgi:hypothetical protein
MRDDGFCEHRSKLAWQSGPRCAIQCIAKRETQLVKLTADRPYSAPEQAARRLMVHALAFLPTYDGRIYIEKINAPFLFGDKAAAAEYSAGLKLAIDRGWLDLHESGTYVKLTQSGAELFAS